MFRWGEYLYPKLRHRRSRLPSTKARLAATRSVPPSTATRTTGWPTTRSERARNREKIYVNVNRKVEHQMSEGFLAISQLKYQLARLRVLKTWMMVEQSGLLVPVGVKTDGVFVRRPVKREAAARRKTICVAGGRLFTLIRT